MDDLADTAAELVTYLRFYVDMAMRATDPADQAGGADAATIYFQGVGICELLLDAEVDAFFHHLIRSGRSRRRLLQGAQARAGCPDRILRASNTRGFFAAVAAMDWQLAGDIAALSPTAHLPKVEYEEDFAYAHFLHQRIAGAPDPAQAAALAVYEQSAADPDTPRVRLCRALVANDAAEAGAAFDELLVQRERELDELRQKSLEATDDLFVPLSSVFIEGLAWLRLFDRAGLPSRSEYPFCPSLARADRYATYVPSGIFPD